MSKRSGAEKRHPRVRTTPFLPIFASENTAIMAQRKIIHVDMDAFFASVEQRDNPAYRGRPIAVGYDGPRGVVATASYEARPYGVHSALPSAVARRLCPSLIFVPARFEVYKEVSQQIRAIFHRYTELVEPLSLDEAFLDVSHHRSATLVAREIKAAIRAETGLTASAGISVNKMLAKIASDYRKPDGLFTIAPAQVEEFVAALPVERFFGIGEVTAERMHRLGILAENRKEILEAFRLPNLVVDGVFSHLYVSDSLEAEDVAYTQEQLTLFYDTVAWLRTAGYDPGKVHIQSSYGLWNLPAQPCDYVRAGIALYGVRSDDAPVQRSLDLRPVLSLRARVASIRTVQAGESAGYGRVFQAEQETKLAVVTIGYADGLPRDLPQRGGQVLIQGRRCPMVGRMCMDQLLVDVSDLSEVAPDDTVTIIGRDGGQVIRAEELAACCGTITNELLSRLGMRLPIVSG